MVLEKGKNQHHIFLSFCFILSFFFPPWRCLLQTSLIPPWLPSPNIIKQRGDGSSMRLIQTPQHCISNETENQGPSPMGIKQGTHPSAGSQGSVQLQLCEISNQKSHSGLKQSPDSSAPCPMCVVRQLAAAFPA